MGGYLRQRGNGQTEKAEDAAMLPVNQTLSDYADSAVRVARSGGWLQGLRTLFIGLGSGGLLLWGIHDQSQATPAGVVSRHFCMRWQERYSSCASTFTCMAEAWLRLRDVSSSAVYGSALRMRISYPAPCPAQCCSNMLMIALRSNNGLNDWA